MPADGRWDLTLAFKGLNRRYCAHRQLFLLETIFTALNVICETCRTTLQAFHTNKQRLVDLNDRVEHDVVLLSATERLRLWKQISLCLPYMAIFHRVYFSSKLSNLWHWLHCLTSSIHNQNRTSLACQELVTIRRQETRVLTRCEVLVGHKTRYYWQTSEKQAGKDTLLNLMFIGPCIILIVE